MNINIKFDKIKYSFISMVILSLHIIDTIISLPRLSNLYNLYNKMSYV